jgi:hypothetical protein
MSTRRAERQEDGANLWPEATWLKIEGALGLAEPDAVMRDDIRQAVALYIAAPRLTDELYLDADDVRPVHAAEVQRCARTLAETASGAARLRAQLLLPRSKETRLARLLVHHLLRDHPTIAEASERRPLEPNELALLGAQARAFRYVARRGPGPNWALTGLMRRLTRVIEGRCGLGAATLGWNEMAETPCGLLYEVFAIIQGQVPELAHKTPRALYHALRRACARRGR